MVLHLIKLQHLPHLSIDKRSTIVTYDSMRHPKSDNYIFLNEVCYNSSSGFAERYGLCLFSEIFYRHKDPNVSVRRWINWSYQIEPPSVKGSWSDRVM